MTSTFNPWPIRDVGDGNVGWIQGRIVGEPPLIAPFSKRPCFYYHGLVDGQGEERRAVDELMIEDGTGRAVIVLAGVVVQLDYDHADYLPPHARGPLGPRRREAILGPGELIAVHGQCNWERDPSPLSYGLYREPLPQRLRVTRTTRVELWVSEDVAGRRR